MNRLHLPFGPNYWAVHRHIVLVKAIAIAIQNLLKIA